MRTHLSRVRRVGWGLGAVQLAVMLAGAGCSARRIVPCDLYPLEGDEGHIERCAISDARGTFTVLPEALPRVWPGPWNEPIGQVFMRGGGLRFVNATGRTAPAYYFDNGADDFVEGRARTTRDGKVGFVDTSLNEVVPPVWDFAEPFSGGYSIVCQGCVPVPSGEYHMMVGGRWGAIDRAGRVVVHLQYSSGREVPVPGSSPGSSR